MSSITTDHLSATDDRAKRSSVKSRLTPNRRRRSVENDEYRGYVALLQGRHRAAVRGTTAALAAPGAHPVQIAYDTLQAAQAYAGLGDIREAKSLLHRASDLVTDAGEPPESLYWYTEPFLRMNIGLTQHAVGMHRDAVDSLTSGIDALPADQQNAEWLDEYQQALDYAEVARDGPPPSQD